MRVRARPRASPNSRRSTGQFPKVESRLATCAGGEETTQINLDFSESVVTDYRLDRSDLLKVTIERNGTCSVEYNLTSVVYNGLNGRSVGYEAGGVFRSDWAGSHGTWPLSYPFDLGQIGFKLFLTERLYRISDQILLDVSRTADQSNDIQRALFYGPCSRPDNITMRVNSGCQTGRESYLQGKLPKTWIDWLASGTVLARVEDFHLATDDSRNHFIDLQQGSLEPCTYMDTVFSTGSRRRSITSYIHTFIPDELRVYMPDYWSSPPPESSIAMTSGVPHVVKNL